MNFLKKVISIRSFCCSVLYIVSILILVSAWKVPAYADIISLKDGSLINGKILKRTSSEIIFYNYYGKFTIEKQHIRRIRETSNYNQDVSIYRSLGKEVNVDVIKRNFDSGSRAKKELQDGGEVGSSDPGTSSLRIRCSLASSYLVTTGKLKEFFPEGYGQFLAFDFGLRKSVFLPSLRTEFGFIYYGKEKSRITGQSAMAGPLWLFPFIRGHNGRIHLSVISGVTYLNQIKGDTFKVNDYTSSLSSTFGYDYNVKNTFLFFHGRYLHVFGDEVSLGGAGVEFGIGYRFK